MEKLWEKIKEIGGKKKKGPSKEQVAVDENPRSFSEINTPMPGGKKPRAIDWKTDLPERKWDEFPEHRKPQVSMEGMEEMPLTTEEIEKSGEKDYIGEHGKYAELASYIEDNKKLEFTKEQLIEGMGSDYLENFPPGSANVNYFIQPERDKRNEKTGYWESEIMANMAIWLVGEDGNIYSTKSIDLTKMPVVYEFVRSQGNVALKQIIENIGYKILSTNWKTSEHNKPKEFAIAMYKLYDTKDRKRYERARAK